MLKIGEFSKLVQVPVATLRYYDQVGLLKPVEVDRFTGYRYYSASQLPRLHRILALKGLGFSLEQIGVALDEGLTPEQMRGMLRLRHAQISQQLDEVQNQLTDVEVRLQQIEREDELSMYDVILKHVEPVLVASVRAILPSHSHSSLLFSEVYEAIGEHVSEALGPHPGQGGQTMVLWYDTEYKEREVDGAAAFILRCPVPARGRMRVQELPAATVASTIHHGSYNTIGEAHEAVLRWLEANGYRIVGPDREINLYNKPPIRLDDPSYVTEIQYPVEKVAPDHAAEDNGMIQQDMIVDIPENRVKYFRGTGKMLLPSPATVANLISTLPEDRLITTELLQDELTGMFDVQGTCPVTLKRTLRAIATDASINTPYWRVLNNKGELIALFPGGVEAQADQLRQHGFKVDTSGKTPRVENFDEQIVTPSPTARPRLRRG